MLVEEVEKRTTIRLEAHSDWPKTNQPVVAIGRISQLQEIARPVAAKLGLDSKAMGAEGYVLTVHQSQGSLGPVVIAGGGG